MYCSRIMKIVIQFYEEQSWVGLSSVIYLEWPNIKGPHGYVAPEHGTWSAHSSYRR